eukprot:12929419-Prorocentrum_lima.AAC.1
MGDKQLCDGVLQLASHILDQPYAQLILISNSAVGCLVSGERSRVKQPGARLPTVVPSEVQEG